MRGSSQNEGTAAMLEGHDMSKPCLSGDHKHDRDAIDTFLNGP